MSIAQIIVLAFAAILLGQIRTYRSFALMAFSAFVLYWLQPLQAPITLTFWLPSFTLLLIVFLWFFIIRDDTTGYWRRNLPSLLILSAVMILIGANRFLKFDEVFTTDTPRMQWVFAAVVVMFSPSVLASPLNRARSVLSVLAAVSIVALLVFVKLPSLQGSLIETISSARAKEMGEWAAISWLGFSYIAFRLLHTIFDKRAGRLPSVSLSDYINYVIFFPTIVAGPIDRVERFARDLNEPAPLDSAGWFTAGTRFFMGLFKKFVLADGLEWIALNQHLVRDLQSPGWLWLLLYAYSLRIYFDFSGYTDMAIGLGRFLGVRFPENFAAPYLKPNLTMFWNSWHMTLTQWFRSYLFNPLTRVLRGNQSIPAYIVILMTQVITMVTIGLWHGISLNYVLWGLWHGIGLFVQNRWSYGVRHRAAPDELTRPAQNRPNLLSVFLTFNYVSLGWLFFILPTPDLVLQAMMKLVGWSL